MTSPQTDPAQWQNRPERSNMAMLRIMSWISLRLGRAASRVVLHLIAAYFLLFAPASRRASRKYLALVLGRRPRLLDIYRHFHCFACTIHDRIYLLNQRFDLFDLDVHGGEQVLQAAEGGKGLLLIGAHLGSFEVMRAIGRQYGGLRVAMAMYEENARKLNQMLGAINPAAHLDVIGLGKIDSMLQVSERLDQGMLVGLMGDRSFNADALRTMSLLGSPAGLPLGPFRMAAILRRPVFFMTGLYLGANRYEIHFEKLADFSEVARGERSREVEQAMLCYAGLLEKYCRRAPYNWFNFFDFWQSAAPAENAGDTRTTT
jgi:predicted LPLAT superfamily acyltransferase